VIWTLFFSHKNKYGLLYSFHHFIQDQLVRQSHLGMSSLMIDRATVEHSRKQCQKFNQKMHCNTFSVSVFDRFFGWSFAGSLLEFKFWWYHCGHAVLGSLFGRYHNMSFGLDCFIFLKKISIDSLIGLLLKHVLSFVLIGIMNCYRSVNHVTLHLCVKHIFFILDYGSCVVLVLLKCTHRP